MLIGSLSTCATLARGQGGLGAPSADTALVERGAYLARVADCVACHTVPGGKPFAGGLAITLPFGEIHSPNITPDRDTGIGRYTDDEFVRAMQRGVARDGRHLYPAFPYVAYTLMPREDILAVKAYLFSLPSVTAPLRVDNLAFPFNQRWGLVFWNALFNPDHRFRPDPHRSAEWNRGAYLIEGPGHCAQCHTPRNFALAVDRNRAFAGAVAQGWRAYNLTPDEVSGIGAWSDDELASYLAKGHADRHGAAAGPMAEVVENSGRYMAPTDLHDMVVYLRSLTPIRNDPAVAGAVAQHPLDASASDGGTGERLFASVCSTCHGSDGRGVQDASATLIGNRTVNDPTGTNLVNVLVEGARLRNGTGAIAFMPPFGAAYTDGQIASLANFVNRRFGNRTLALKAADVAAIRRANVDGISPTLIEGMIGTVIVLLLIAFWAVRAAFRRLKASPDRPPLTA